MRRRVRNGIVANCRPMRRLLKQAAHFARLSASILIAGPSGSGKEGLARFIHDSSGRTGRFVPVNAASLGPALAESELFGHQRGAFTGAVSAREGLFKAADGGTLFLDEVGELTLEVQARLLRVLEQKRVRRVGDTRELPVDFRIVAATHRNLEEMVLAGTFRADLLFRLARCCLEVPPLKDRYTDIVAIARHFLATDRDLKPRRFMLSRDAGRVLMSYDWPGNVRELQSVLLDATSGRCGRRIRAFHIRRALGDRLNSTSWPEGESVGNLAGQLASVLVGRLEGSRPSNVAGHPAGHLAGNPAGARAGHLVGNFAGALLALLCEEGEMEAVQLCQRFGMSRPVLLRRLKPFLEAGSVVRIGAGADTRYCLGEGNAGGGVETDCEAQEADCETRG